MGVSGGRRLPPAQMLVTLAVSWELDLNRGTTKKARNVTAIFVAFSDSDTQGGQWWEAKNLFKRFLRRLKRKSERYAAVTFSFAVLPIPSSASWRLRRRILERRGQTSSTRTDVLRFSPSVLSTFKNLRFTTYAYLQSESHGTFEGTVQVKWRIWGP